MHRGKLIVFEGIDNCGKDSAIAHINYELNRRYKLAKIIQSVTNTPLGRLIRTITTNRSEMRPNNLQLVPLFIADFYSKLDIIEEYLSMGYTVLCNRWYTSTLAYCDSDTDRNAIKKLIKTDIKPDLLFYLQIPVKESIDRAKEANKLTDVYNNKCILEQAKSVYDDLFVNNNEFNAIVIEADLPLTLVMRDIKNKIKEEGILDGPKKRNRRCRNT